MGGDGAVSVCGGMNVNEERKSAAARASVRDKIDMSDRNKVDKNSGYYSRSYSVCFSLGLCISS